MWGLSEDVGVGVWCIWVWECVGVGGYVGGCTCTM